jgi:hypothetical protein
MTHRQIFKEFSSRETSCHPERSRSETEQKAVILSEAEAKQNKKLSS